MAGMTCGDCAGKVKEALEGVEGVQVVSVILDPAEAVVTVPKGADASALLAAVQAAGFKASVQTRDTWALVLPEGLGADRAALEKVGGVVQVRADGQGISVTAYVPHVTTCALLAAAGPGVTVRTEEVRLKVSGAKDAAQLDTVVSRIAGAWGVVAVKAQQDGTLLLVREAGRAGLQRLNDALQGTGCSVVIAG